MSKTPQSRPSLLERLYYRDPTRAKVYRQRMLLWESDPQALADAGQRELAAIAAALKHDPAAQPERWVECYEADEQMDQAADLLRSGRWQVARPLLAAAAKAYRVAGESRLWDLADAVWNLGYTYSAVGLPRDAMVSLRAAARLLRLQMRFRDWTRCTASLLMVRTAWGLEETPDGRVTEMIRLCKVFGWPEEFLRLALLTAYHLAQGGDSNKARRTLDQAEEVARRIGQAGIELIGMARDDCRLENIVCRSAERATNRTCPSVSEACTAIQGLDLDRASLEQVYLSLRVASMAAASGGTPAGLERLQGALLRNLARRLADNQDPRGAQAVRRTAARLRGSS